MLGDGFAVWQVHLALGAVACIDARPQVHVLFEAVVTREPALTLGALLKRSLAGWFLPLMATPTGYLTSVAIEVVVGLQTETAEVVLVYKGFWTEDYVHVLNLIPVIKIEIPA